MGYLLMEPEDIVAYVDGQAFHSDKNFTSICTSPFKMHSKGLFNATNPLEFSVPLLILQFALCSGVIIFFSWLLKPLGQPLIVSQILGGIVLGSSVLGQFKSFKWSVFPVRGFILLDVISSFGFMFYFFLIGVQMDLWIIKKIDKRAFSIGFFAVAMPMILTSLCTLWLMNNLDPRIAKSLPLVAQAESVFAFPMIAYFLTELNIFNSEFGRIALLCSMVGGLCSFCFISLSVILNHPTLNKCHMLSTVATSIVLGSVIVFSIRPAVMWMIKHNPVGQPLKDSHVFFLLLGVLVTGFCSQATGLNLYFGPLILGITIPAGPPVGSGLVERLDFVTSWILMPIFFVKIGLVINIFTIKLKTFLVLSFLAFVGAMGKFLGAFLTSLYFKLPVRDAISLGLILNSQGALELGLFKAMKKNKVIDNETFAVMCISMLCLIAMITPIIRYLYDPSRKYAVYRRRSVMHSRPDSDLCVSVCIHDQEDVPIAINLLEALCPTRRSQLIIYVVHLVELIGHANPLLIPHKLAKVRSSKAFPSERIVNAFRCYGQSNNDLVAVYSYTAISPFAAVHDDVCMLSLDKRTSLILIPFHKRFHSNGVMSTCKSKIKTINNNILDKAPCSVAIIVDRGLLKGARPITSNWSSFHVAIVFIGGPDDREAMFIGARMAAHPNTYVTMIRPVESGNVKGEDVEERRLDNEAVSEFRQRMVGNDRVMYIEEVVTDGTGTVSVLRAMGNNFELVMVGRRHSLTSPLIQGLVLWNEHTELGAIGEVLATSEFIGKALILVVQQHTNVVNEGQEPYQEKETTIHMDRYLADDDAEDMPIQGRK